MHPTGTTAERTCGDMEDEEGGGGQADSAGRMGTGSGQPEKHPYGKAPAVTGGSLSNLSVVLPGAQFDAHRARAELGEELF